MPVKQALKRVGFWVSLALMFNIGIYFALGKQQAMEFLGGYLIEQMLSIDNLFVFLLVFSIFEIKPKYQARILTFGIAGAIILRFIFILLGSSLIHQFEWILYIFGAILIYSGFKMIMVSDKESHDMSENKVLTFAKKFIPFTDTIESEKFFLRKNGILYATPLFAALIVIEISDIMFAIDSIPAIFSITTDTFIVYTSNIFAILGLRSMYFLLEKMNSLFRYVKYGVGAVLVFTGIKLSLLIFAIHIPIVISLLIIISILALSVLGSVVFKDLAVENE